MIIIDDRNWEELTEEEQAEQLKGIPPLSPEREKELHDGLIEFAKKKGWKLNEKD